MWGWRKWIKCKQVSGEMLNGNWTNIVDNMGWDGMGGEDQMLDG